MKPDSLQMTSMHLWWWIRFFTLNQFYINDLSHWVSHPHSARILLEQPSDWHFVIRSKLVICSVFKWSQCLIFPECCRDCVEILMVSCFFELVTPRCQFVFYFFHFLTEESTWRMSGPLTFPPRPSYESFLLSHAASEKMPLKDLQHDQWSLVDLQRMRSSSDDTHLWICQIDNERNVPVNDVLSPYLTSEPQHLDQSRVQ